MTYAEKMTMKLMGEMAYNYGNQPETLKTVQQIIADAKRASKISIESKLLPIDLGYCQRAIDRAEVKEEKDE